MAYNPERLRELWRRHNVARSWGWRGRMLDDVLAAGAAAAAATVHYVDDGVDTGDVIASEPVPVLPGDTVETLRERVHEAEHRLLPKVVRELCAR